MKNRFRQDGSCSTCLGGNLCRHCSADSAKRDAIFSRVLQQAAAGIRENRIARVCSRFELESDEFLTREQKACAMLATNPALA